MSDEDTGIGGMLIFSICFLGFFIALVGIGNDFFVNSTSYREYVTSDLDASNLISLNFTKNATVTYPASGVLFDFTPNVNVKLDLSWTVINPYLHLEHIHNEFYGYYYNYEPMYFEDESKFYIGKSDILANWNPNASTFYPVRDKDLTVHFFVRDYNHTRNNVATAWDEGKLDISIGFGIDDYTASLTAWDIIGRLLMFQSPEIMGLTGDMATIFGWLLSLPIWTCIAYLIYRLILMALPFFG